MTDNTKTIIGATAIFAALVLFAYFLPVLMLAAADVSPYAAGVVGVLFLFGFFFVLWLRGRSKR